MTYRLVARIGARLIRFPLAEGQSIVGAKSDCDITLDHPSVSRRHALVVVRDSDVTVSDLGSRNGTRIGRKRIRSISLRPGDTINFGAVAAKLETISDDDAVAAIEISEAGAEETSPEREQSTTLRSGPAETFVVEYLPKLLISICEHRNRNVVAQLIGESLFEGLPCVEVRVGPENDADDTVVFTARRTIESGASDHPVIVSRAGLEFRVSFNSDVSRGLYAPLVRAVTTMVGIVGSPISPTSGAPGRRDAEPIPLPAPPTVVPSMKSLFEQARRVARSDLSVLITGESGTGKEIVARFIHRSSTVSDGPFLALNCASLPRDLLESELFGIERGVATGVEARPGKFEAAADGTLFLDEIGDMAPETQARILRVLQSREVYRLGGRRPIPVSCRIVAATNRDLKSMLHSGAFREDLYHRIAGWVVEIPPLRHRRADIPNLAAFFLSTEAERIGLRIRGISRAAVDALTSFSWPGNVRQLEQEMARAVLFLENDELLDCSRLSDEIRSEEAVPGGILSRALERVEIDEITMALERCPSVDAAAESLGISRATLYRRIRALGITTGNENTEGGAD